MIQVILDSLPIVLLSVAIIIVANTLKRLTDEVMRLHYIVAEILKDLSTCEEVNEEINTKIEK